jgi:ribonucleotide reductase beta subunit family protein with ferritin-like domain
MENSKINFAWEQDNKESERLSIRPIIYEDIYGFRDIMEGLHWTAQEVDLSKDLSDWNKLTEGERNLMLHQLAFFVRGDIDIFDNIEMNFSAEMNCLEVKFVYAGQKNQECTHSESYALQIEAVLNSSERKWILNAAKNIPIIYELRQWMLKWFDRKIPIGERLIAFGIVEGVIFSASFAAIQWMRTKNVLHGITASNEFIARDEGVHTLFACLLVKKYLLIKPSQERISEIFYDAIKIIDKFVQLSLPNDLVGMNANLMMQYIRFQSDCVTTGMGYSPIFKVDNPFGFMDALTLNGISKTDFFAKRTTQYQNPTKMGSSKLTIDKSTYVIED